MINIGVVSNQIYILLINQLMKSLLRLWQTQILWRGNIIYQIGTKLIFLLDTEQQFIQYILAGMCSRLEVYERRNQP